MRESLQQRIANGLEARPRPREDQAKLVEDLARVLRQAAESAAASRPGGPGDQPLVNPKFELPQILQPKPVVVRENRAPVLDWIRGLPRDIAGLLASAPLTAALVLAGAMLVAVAWRGDLQVLEASKPPSQQAANAHFVVQSVKTVPIDPNRASKADLVPAVLVSTAERMLAEGNVIAARELLGRAALAGDSGARFALAETFDPNVLAAWGVRGVSADPGTARLLYEQAMAAGDQRAERRLKALIGE